MTIEQQFMKSFELDEIDSVWRLSLIPPPAYAEYLKLGYIKYISEEHLGMTIGAGVARANESHINQQVYIYVTPIGKALIELKTL